MNDEVRFLCGWLLAGALLPLGSAAATAAPPAGHAAEEVVRRAESGDAAATSDLESLLEPFFARKDLWTLSEEGAAREAGKLLGSGGGNGTIHWWALDAGEAPLRLLTLDFKGQGSKGYTAYAVIERGRTGDPSVSWYHDLGRKIAEQGGVWWHPLSARLLPGTPGGGPSTLLVEASSGSTGPVAGLLVFERRGDDWQASRRIAPPPGARFLGAGPLGAVFVTDRPPPKGVLSGAPAGLFQSLILYERSADGFAADSVTAPLQDVVTITEAILAALRRHDKSEASRMAVSPDVIEQMLYFTPDWSGGGRIVKAGPRSLEIVYEERERPSLRIELAFKNEDGVLKLASATGHAEGAKP